MFQRLNCARVHAYFLPCVCFAILALGVPSRLAGQALESSNPQAVSLYKEGLQLAGQDKFNEAIEKLSQAIKTDPNFIQAHLRYMDAFRSAGRGKEVVTMYENLLKQNPSSALYHFLYGRTLNDMDAKRAEYKKALAVDPTFYWAQLGIGGSYLIEKRYDEAIVALNKTLNLKPGMVDAMRLLAGIYLEKSMPHQARRLLEEAVMSDSTDSGTYIRLGQAYSQLERFQSAEKAFLKAISLEPEEPLIYYYLGLSREIGNNRQGALEAYRKFLDMAPEHELAQSARKNIEKLSK
jgi:tetratricopeptide (TPR) repeat protein